jgi:hypothetical protein
MWYKKNKWILQANLMVRENRSYRMVIHSPCFIAHLQRAFHQSAPFLTQHFPRDGQIAPCLSRAAHGKGLTQKSGATSLSRDSCTFPESAKQERNSIGGEGMTRFREKKRVLAGLSLIDTFHGLWTTLIEI